MFILSNRLKLLAQRVKLLTVGLWHGTLYFFFFFTEEASMPETISIIFHHAFSQRAPNPCGYYQNETPGAPGIINRKQKHITRRPIGRESLARAGIMRQPARETLARVHVWLRAHALRVINSRPAAPMASSA